MNAGKIDFLVNIQAGFIYIVIILFVQGPLRMNDGCGKMIKAGTMDRGSTVYVFARKGSNRILQAGKSRNFNLLEK